MSDKNSDARGVESSETGEENELLPFVAPCNGLAVSAPFEWLKGGWKDYKSAPGLSFAWGLFFWLLSSIITFVAWKLGGWVFTPQHAVGIYFCSAAVGIRFVLGQQATVPGQ